MVSATTQTQVGSTQQIPCNLPDISVGDHRVFTADMYDGSQVLKDGVITITSDSSRIKVTGSEVTELEQLPKKSFDESKVKSIFDWVKFGTSVGSKVVVSAGKAGMGAGP